MIYLDHAATTPICDAAKKAIIEHLDDYGNPSSSYEFGHKSLMLIEDARERIAKCINAEPEEIYFTSGGSEADTWALNGRLSLASSIEHHAICSNFRFRAALDGIIDFEDMKRILLSNKIYSPNKIDVVSCMYVNNEIGTIQPIKEIANIAHNNGIYFHTDAVQACGHIPIDVKDLNVDMLSASGHKFGAPKGTGFLYVRKGGPELDPLIRGGKQERGLRGGTENVLGIIAMAAALEDSVAHMEERNEYIYTLRGKLLHQLLSMPGVYLNGSLYNRVASNINVRINGVKGQDVIAMADEYGICISAGSACNEGTATPSHVLKAIGHTDEQALSSVRITLGYENTMDEIDYVCETLPKIIQRLRSINIQKP
jgi:cysteine desulfurase